MEFFGASKKDYTIINPHLLDGIKSKGPKRDIKTNDANTLDQILDLIDALNSPALFIIDLKKGVEVGSIFSSLQNKLMRLHCFVFLSEDGFEAEGVLKVQSALKKVTFYGSLISFDENTIITYPQQEVS